MNRILTWGSLFVAFGLVAGCSGGGSEHEAAIKDFISILNEATATLSRVNDKASAEKAITELKDQTERMKKLAQKVKQMGNPSKAEDERLKKTYEPEMKASTEKFQKESQALTTKIGQGKIPPDMAVKLGEAIKGLGLAMMEFGTQKK